MEEYHRPCDEVGFNADEAHNIVKECIDGVLGGEDYNQNNINQWTASIVEQSLAHLVKLGKAYKYIVTCAVVQRSPYGFHTASSCFWDTTSDGKRLCMCMLSHFSPVRLFVTPWTVAHQVPLSTGSPRQEYWSGLPFPSPGDLPAPGIEPTSLMSPALAGRFLPLVPPGNPPFPSPGNLPDPGIKPRSSTLQADALTFESPRKP
ncbi:dynein light chain Tctex-type 3 isoform X1 [Ovis aries]|uniref:dynein light chain Tctex-type 3 isoform X1 n=1 Tax=Ovis aries TaxID=9940 RepID=UPI00295263F2|nr:dynein light chain Tctex-type 3 isoform X1 [Ovis aries]